MKEKISIFSLLVLINIVSYSQQLFSIKGSFDIIDLDNIDNIYAVKTSELQLYNSNGEFLKRYSNKINGIISSIDVTNPLRILVFFKEINTLVFLDHQLSPLSDPIDIYEATNIDASMIGISTGGSFWAFSNEKQCLMLFNSKFEKIQESQNLRDWIEGQSIEFIREHNQKVYLGLNNKVLVFDTFGLYLTTLHFNGAQFLKMIAGQISYVKGKSIWLYNPTLKNETEIPLPESMPTKSVFSNGRVIIFNFGDSVTVNKTN